MDVGDRVLWGSVRVEIRALYDVAISPEDCDRYVPPECAAVRLDEGGVAYVTLADLTAEVSP